MIYDVNGCPFWECEHVLFWGCGQENLTPVYNQKEWVAFHGAAQEPDEGILT